MTSDEISRHALDPPPPPVSGVRPFLITGGRARGYGASLDLETQVLSTRDGLAIAGGLAYERRDIVTLCVRPMSVAEIGAHLGHHLGVIRVLVADLVAMGLLIIRRPEADPQQQVEIIERVIRGLTAIR
ncbi:MAG: hypothetical protein QOE61_4442 [Micromonosporaceae bacterium]|jgi:hypothetical protein|nr:hypothetical protein [Micromonosporaceae bacterium]